MSDDVLITPASRKIEFKDSGGTVDAKIETDSSGNLNITNPGGDISIGDTTADVFIGDGVNNIDLVFEQNAEIRGTSGVTLTLGDSNTTLRTGTDLSLNSNDITNVGTISTGRVTITNNAVPLIFNESGHSGTGQWWRMPLDGGDLRFDVSLTGGSNFTTYDAVLQLNADGNVGRGSGPAADKLEIKDNHSQLRLTDSDDNKFVQFSYSGGFLAIRNNNASTSVNLVSLHEDGDFGIGTLAPDQKLDVRGNVVVGSGGASDYNILYFKRYGVASVCAIWWHSDAIFYIGGHPNYGSTAGNTVRVYGFGSDLHLGDNSNGDVITVKYSNGNVGIGTTSPATPLHMYKGSLGGGTGVTDMLRIELNRTDHSATPSGPAILFKDQDTNNSTNEARIKMMTVNDTDYGDNDEAASNLIFETTDGGTASDKMIITGRGDVGIGILAPNQKLHVGGSIATSSGSITSFGNVTTGNGYVDGKTGFKVNNVEVITSARNLTNIGTISSSGASTITNTSGLSGLTLKNTSGGAFGSYLTFDHLSGSPANGDISGGILFRGYNSADETINYGLIRCVDTVVTDGSERGYLSFLVKAGGASEAERMRVHSAGVRIKSGSANWNTTTQGTTIGSLHLDPENSSNNFGSAITFGASDTGSGDTAQAGIYTRTDGNYGTKMYFATTDSYADGSKTALEIDQVGDLYVTKGNFIVPHPKGIVTKGSHDSYGVLRVTNPGGAIMYSRNSSATGAIKITLPVSWTSTMLRMTIQIYEYSNDESFTVYCGGYNYGTSSTWVNTFAQIISSTNVRRNFNVRFAHDGSKCTIFIGELNSTWSYPQVAVTDCQAGFGNATVDNFEDGWSVSLETSSLGTVSVTESNVDITEFMKDGTQSAPALRFKSDTNLGIYRDTTDRIGFAMGGTTKLTMGTKSGYAASSYGPIVETNSDTMVLPTTAYFNNSNVYLQKISTSAKLHGDGGVRFSYYNGSATTEGMRLNGASGGGQLQFPSTRVVAPTTSNAVAGARLNLYPLGSGQDYTIGIESGNMWFNTNGGFKWYRNGYLRMHLDNSTLMIGSGTIDSDARLQVQGEDTSPSLGATTPSSYTALFTNSDVNYGMLFGVQSNGNGEIQQRRTNNATYYSLNLQPYGGKVGIGVGNANPSVDAGLHVRGSTAGSGETITNLSGLLVENNGSSPSYYVFQTATTGGGKSFTITNAGNVGVGESAPAGKLHVKSGDAGSFSANSNHDDVIVEGSGNTGIQIISPNSTYQYLAFGDPDAVNAGYIRYHHSTNQMEFRANAIDLARLNRDAFEIKGGAGLRLYGGIRSTVEEGTKYLWQHSGHGTDLNWKKVADVTLPTGLYKALRAHLKVKSAHSNFGAQARFDVSEYNAVFYRSGGTQDSPNNASLNGSDTDSHELRIVKTSTGVYELQAKAKTNYRDLFIEIDIMDTNGGDFTLTTGNVNGSTSGTVYSTSKDSAYRTTHLLDYLRVGDGSSGAPSLSFASDTNTGIYRYSSDNLGFATGGVFRGVMNSLGFSVNGSEIEVNGSTNNWKYLRLANSGSSKWDIATKDNDLSGALQFRPAAGENGRTYISTSGDWTFGGGILLSAQGTATNSSTQYNSETLQFTASGWDTNNSVARSVSWKIRNVPTASVYPDHDLKFIESDQGNEYTKFQLHGRGSTNHTDPKAATFYGNVHVEGGSGTNAGAGELSIHSTLTITEADSEQTNNRDNTTIPDANGTPSMKIQSSSYTDGRYTTRIAKIDRSGGLPVYFQESLGTANSYTNRMRVGTHGRTNGSYVVETFGHTMIGGRLGIADSGEYIRKYTSAWSNAPEQTVLSNSYKTNLGDYVTLKAAGNGTSGHGAITVADNGIYFGRSNAETGELVPNNNGDATLDVNYGHIDATGLNVKGTNSTFYSSTSNNTVAFGRNANEKLEVYVNDSNVSLTAYQDADSNANHTFILNRSFAGTGANDFQIQKGGSAQLKIDTNGSVQILDGTAGTPSLSFMNDTNTGIYRVGSDHIGIRAGSQYNGFNISSNTISHETAITAQHPVLTADTWKKIAKIDTRGGSRIICSYTGGAKTPVTYIFTVFKDWSTGTSMSVEKLGDANHIKKARIKTDSDGKYYVELLFATNTANYNFYIYHQRIVGYDALTTLYTGTLPASGTGTVSETLNLPGNDGYSHNGSIEGASLMTNQYIYHRGDTDTYIRMTDDRLRFVAGNVNFLDLIEGASDYVHFPQPRIRVGSSAVMPNAALELVGNNTATPADGAGTGGQAAIRISNTNTTTSASSTIIFNANDANGNSRHGAAIQFKKTSQWLGNGSYPGELYFWTRPSTGNQAAALKLDKDGNGIFKGNVTAYGSLSDRNLKENIENIPNAVEKVQELNGVTFNYKKDDKKATGIIAQELQEVLPEAVYTTADLETKEEHLAIHYGNVVGLLVEALKEQQTKIDNLTALVNELKEK